MWCSGSHRAISTRCAVHLTGIWVRAMECVVELAGILWKVFKLEVPVTLLSFSKVVNRHLLTSTDIKYSQCKQVRKLSNQLNSWLSNQVCMFLLCELNNHHWVWRVIPSGRQAWEERKRSYPSLAHIPLLLNWVKEPGGNSLTFMFTTTWYKIYALYDLISKNPCHLTQNPTITMYYSAYQRILQLSPS